MSSCWYICWVTEIWEWPRISWASRAGMPRFLSSVAVVCRTSWTRIMRMSCWLHIRWNERTKLRGSIGRPLLVVRINSLSLFPPIQVSAAAARRSHCLACCCVSATRTRLSNGRFRCPAAVLTGPWQSWRPTRCSWFRICSSPRRKSTSHQRSPSTSPRRSPYSTSSRNPG
jgi:hypothetical protein